MFWEICCPPFLMAVGALVPTWVKYLLDSSLTNLVLPADSIAVTGETYADKFKLYELSVVLLLRFTAR
jgi:hypothetical protein